MIKNVQIILLNICFNNIFGVKKTLLVSSKVKLYPQMTHIPTRYYIVLDPCNIRVEQQLGVHLLLLVLHKHLVRGAGVVVECQVGLQVSERHPWFYFLEDSSNWQLEFRLSNMTKIHPDPAALLHPLLGTDHLLPQGQRLCVQNLHQTWDVVTGGPPVDQGEKKKRC